MLTAAKHTGALTAKCDKCRATLAMAERDIDAARVELVRLGWLEAAQRGRGRDGWLWWCPACAPKPASGFGASTGDMKPAK